MTFVDTLLVGGSKKASKTLLNLRKDDSMFLKFPTLRSYLPYVILGAFALLLFVDPALADIFAKPVAKARAIKLGLMNFAKVSVAVAFLACLVGALAGRINWRWVGVVFVVAIAIATFDLLLGFLEV